MGSKLNLCCLFGGKSTEYEVSLNSAFTIMSNANVDKYNLIKVGITNQGQWYFYDGSLDDIKYGKWSHDLSKLKKAFISPNNGEKSLYIFNDKENTYSQIPIDVVFPMMHGAFSEDGTMQGLLAMSGIPFVGSGCTSSAVCMDKAFTKLILNNYNIPQANVLVVTRDEICVDFNSVKIKVETKFQYPIFIKPSNTGSSIGVSKVLNADMLNKALVLASSYDYKVIIEEFICGREIEVAVMGNNEPIVSICGEVAPGSEFYDYDTKYINDTASYFIPARISDDASNTIRSIAAKIYNILGCEGLSRVDFFVRLKDGVEEVIFNEINTLPGFNQISMYPKLFVFGGMSIAQIVDKLIDFSKNE